MTTPPRLGERAQHLRLGPELQRMSRVWVEKGLTLCRLARYDEALSAFEKSLALEARNPRAWYNKGLTLATLGRYVEAIAAYDRALELDDARPFLWLQKGLALAALGKLTDALFALDRALELDPTDALAWQHRGGILFRLERYDEALAAYDHTLDLGDDHAVVWQAKGAAVAVDLPARQATLRMGPGWLTLPPDSPPDSAPDASPTPAAPAPRPQTPSPSAGKSLSAARNRALAPRARSAVGGAARSPLTGTQPAVNAATRLAATPQAAAPAVATESAPSESPVPERPQLAANVTLHGEMKETGFQQTQWLAEREGRFIQLTELLYRVLERCDGAHTLAEIAAAAGAATGKNLSAENVAYLLTTRLIPTRLVIGVEGAIVPQAPGAPPPARTPARSPLSVNLRFAPFSPRVVNGAASLFQHLFAPPILVLGVLLGLAGQFWLYRLHHYDFAAHLAQAFAHPKLLVGALGLTMLATLFHELGHASALRYGGARARRMGMGFYLAVPVFYTDVSENYRLGRWARIRTDLGGFYFNLLADLVFFGLYFVTHQELLLFAVAATNIEILVNLLPFGRFDGYWALADLTGIPDFFALMKPFVRSLVPLPFLRGPKLPPLKPWVRAVYALYTLIAVPVLLLIFAGLFLAIPTTIPHGVESLVGFVRTLAHAHAIGDTRGIVTALVSIVTLAIILIPLLYMVFNLARTLLTLLVRLPRRLLSRRRVSVAS